MTRLLMVVEFVAWEEGYNTLRARATDSLGAA
jgi:hypothetical protein